MPDGDGGTLRMAYVEAGPADGPVALLLHGEPSWSFLYRARDRRARRAPASAAVAPDLVGFGRSDKPTRAEDHTFARHVEWVRALAFDVLDLRDVTLVGQDWGGLIGLRLVAEHPDRFARVVAANTGLPTGDLDMPDVWWRFRTRGREGRDLDVGRLVRPAACARLDRRRCGRRTTRRSRTRRYKAGPRVMPTLVPTSPDDPATEANRAAWETLTQLATCRSWSRSATATRSPAAWRRCCSGRCPGAQGLDHPVLAGAGHFLQEDAGPQLGEVVAAFVRHTLDT